MGKNNSITLALQPSTPRVLSESNMYSKLYYDERVKPAVEAPVCATLIYHILVAAHKPDICTPATAHHPNFSHMLVLLLGSLGVYILY
jgi:hypothetical protein